MKTKMFKLEERQQKVFSVPVKCALVPKCQRYRLSFEKHGSREVKNTQSVNLFQIIFYSDQCNGVMK